ncbi:type 1 glutamine amidotransferase domain-containing protein [Paractinoplanes deccanensis]|uniref:type 1 glutamine amidotransferase domain-containing protein n=1 Tax=Paractinoplanes deccanensis TaxID=113561 RepID=UPI0019453397|nr:type 1 glutamine amidotransferase domain-containing protein [Actinoplanes deccanensis]
MSKILFIMTGADAWTLKDGSKHPTGFWAEEAAVPYQEFKKAGHEIVVATPGGVVSPVDEGSLAGENAKFRAILEAAPEFRDPIALADVDLADYAAVYVPGGHGPMEDLAVDARSGELLATALRAGTPLGVVCHGPAALLAAVDADGRNAFAGYRVTAFTNAEETQAGNADKAIWLLEDRLNEAGVKVEAGAPWSSHVEVDRNLVTGQNPQSSEAVAEALLRQL